MFDYKELKRIRRHLGFSLKEFSALLDVNYNTYNAYIKGEFPENKIWITDYKYFPKIEEDSRWIIWQVSRRGRIEGIPGFTDKNVLRKGMTVEELINQNKIN